jgi:hypothetical protein
MVINQQISKARIISCGMIAVAGMALWAQTGFAAMTGGDNAGNTAYSSGWANGSNGGTGFGPWSLSTPSSSSYFFVQSSGVGDGSGGKIDTLSSSGAAVSWGMAGGNTNQSATRAFLAGPNGNGFLEDGQTFALNFENNFVANGAYVGYSLNDTAGKSLFSVFFLGGKSDFYVNSSPILAGATDLGGNGGGWTNGGVDTTFTLSSPDSYTFTFVDASDLSPQVTEAGTVTGQITGFTAFDTGNVPQFSADNYYLYLNSVSITGTPTPEPATIALFGAAGAGVLLIRRRRSV